MTIVDVAAQWARTSDNCTKVQLPISTEALLTDGIDALDVDAGKSSDEDAFTGEMMVMDDDDGNIKKKQYG